MRSLLLTWAACLFFCSCAGGDVVVFKSGDRLSGKFLHIKDAVLVFDAAEVGKVKIDLTRIASFQTDQPVEFHFQDGTVIKSKANQGSSGSFSLEKTSLLSSQNFSIDQIKAANPPVEPAVKWNGNLTAGLISTHGNTFNESGTVSFKATRRTKRDRLNLNGLYTVNRSEEDKVDGINPITGNPIVKKEKVTTDENLLVNGKYDYFFTEKLYSFASLSFKKDHIADLDRRIIGGLGAGYQWIESDNMNFSTDAGFAELCEQYTRRVLDPASGTEIREITKNDEVSLQLGYSFDWKFAKIFTFTHNLTYYPSLGEVADYYLTTDAELKAALTESLFTSFKAIIDYDSTPAEGIGTTDTKYILGVGWNF